MYQPTTGLDNGCVTKGMSEEQIIDWSNSGDFKELCDNLFNHIVFFLDKPIDIKTLSRTCKRLAIIVKNSPTYELAKRSDHCIIPINRIEELPNNQNTRKRGASKPLKKYCLKTLRCSAWCLTISFLIAMGVILISEVNTSSESNFDS